jgi:CubicO group peptidase (beta-lactamase class C family)
MKRLRQRFHPAFFLLVFLLGGRGTAVSAAAPIVDVEPTCAALETIVDELAQAEMTNAQLPGMIVAIVQDGAVRLEKGYGWADVERQMPVTADESIFQMGSVSKLFTWTAVMQLVEQGELDLHTDVNRYLGAEMQIAPTFEQPITLAHLMAHTAGFEDRVTGIYTQDAAALGSLADFLAANMPARVRPPGELTSYSNYGTALAAYIVQRVSGLPFELYVAENIFTPLAMTSASFQQPVPAQQLSRAATGYILAQGELTPQSPTYTRQVGAGGLTATAQDMSHFMLAYLANGRFHETQLLKPETVAGMMNGRFTHHPQLAGNASGFWEAAVNGHRVLLHSGDTLSFSSLLALLPEENAGIFIAYNRATDAPRQRILAELLTRCWPADSHHVVIAPPAEPADAEPFTGAYRSARIAHTTPARLLAFGWESTVRPAADGGLLVDGQAYTPIGPDSFQQVDGTERVAFRLDGQGRATHLFFDSVPTMAFEKVRWWEKTAVQIIILAVPLLLFLATLLGWTWGALRRNRREGAAARWIAAAMSILSLLVAGLAGVAMMNATAIVFGMPPALATAVWLSYPLAILAVITAGLALRQWWRQSWPRWQRLHYTLLASAGLVYVWFLSYWNLLSF